MGDYYYLRFRCIFGFFNVFIVFFAIYGTWEARASSRHTNLTRRIDPPTPKYLKSPKLKKSGFWKIIFSDPFVIRFLFSMFFFLKKLISYGSAGQTPLWKWIVYGFSSLDLGPSKSILIAFWTSSPNFCWKVVFHFKPSRYKFSLCKG